MKMVINKCYGGFGISREYLDKFGIECDYDIERDDPRLVEAVETDAEAVADRYARLVVVEIPDEATDWELDEYDGAESIIAVVDGKLVHF